MSQLQWLIEHRIVLGSLEEVYGSLKGDGLIALLYDLKLISDVVEICVVSLQYLFEYVGSVGLKLILALKLIKDSFNLGYVNLLGLRISQLFEHGLDRVRVD